jgi:crossover junction endodeoxyribonuclease RusA
MEREPMLTVTLPWPPSNLSPNARQHWAALARAKRAYRRACWAQAIEQGARRLHGVDRLHVGLEFVPPSRRPFDLDNLLARMKAGLDGLADVLGVDDSKWEITIRRGEPPGGFVRVKIEAMGESA